MPHEVQAEEFMELVPLASKCLVKRDRRIQQVKLKLRTKSRLYTLKTSPEEAERILGRLNIPVEEI
ncbi:MAG: hypothetical protein ACFFB3_14740 [Candidatus Hodarchaeota archaeon]